MTLFQVKIWFQNRRAKERRAAKKQEDILQKDKLDVTSAASAVAMSAFTESLSHHPHAISHHPHHPHPALAAMPISAAFAASSQQQSVNVNNSSAFTMASSSPTVKFEWFFSLFCSSKKYICYAMENWNM